MHIRPTVAQDDDLNYLPKLLEHCRAHAESAPSLKCLAHPTWAAASLASPASRRVLAPSRTPSSSSVFGICPTKSLTTSPRCCHARRARHQDLSGVCRGKSCGEGTSRECTTQRHAGRPEGAARAAGGRPAAREHLRRREHAQPMSTADASTSRLISRLSDPTKA